MTTNAKRAAALAGVLSAVSLDAGLQAQSADALIDKLVQKGVLTVKEGKELREEADKDFTKAYSVKSGMPEWVSALKFNGDFRGRYEGFFVDNPLFVDRNRFRYRLRFGATATLKDDFEVGLRLSSGDPVSGFGNNAGNPVSGNTTMQDNASRKFIYVDLAYAKWSLLHNAGWSGALTFGKMENPFVTSHLVFDPDYNPEGLAGQFAYAFSPAHTAKLNAGAFVLDELAASARDPFLGGAQLRLESKWSGKLSTSVGASIFSIMNHGSLANGNVPNVNRGNTRDAAGAPVYGFNPVMGDAWATYTLERFPGYRGAFPVKVGGEFLQNPAAPRQNRAYMAGLTLGKAGHKGLWELSYQYRYLGADSLYEELPDDDFGAFYQAQQLNAGFAGAGSGYGGGTNVRGHVAKASYSPFDSLTLSVTYFDAELIAPSPLGSDSHTQHLLVDMLWKF